MVHCAVTLHTVSGDVDLLFENKAPPLLQTRFPIVLNCDGWPAVFTVSILLTVNGQSEISKRLKIAVKGELSKNFLLELHDTSLNSSTLCIASDNKKNLLRYAYMRFCDIPVNYEVLQN